MTRTPIMRFFPVSIVGLLICYAVTCHAQIPISREDEEAIKKVIAGTTEAFNKQDEKAFAAFYAAVSQSSSEHLNSGMDGSGPISDQQNVLKLCC